MMGVAAISRDLGVGSVISVLQRPAMACAPSQSSRAGRSGLPSPLLSSFGMLANAPPEGDCPMPIEAEVEKRARELADVVHAACVTIQSFPANSATGSATARTSPAAPSTIARSSRTVLILGRLSRTAGSAFGLALAALLWLAGLSGGAAAQPRDVEVGAFVSSISDINPSDGSFRVVLYAWFNDPAGRFNVERDLYLIARTASIDEIETEPAPGGGSYTYARIEAEVPQEFDFRHFPFDRQRLTVRMEARRRPSRICGSSRTMRIPTRRTTFRCSAGRSTASRSTSRSTPTTVTSATGPGVAPGIPRFSFRWTSAASARRC